MEQIHKHVIGVPPLQGNKFYNCSPCVYGKFRNKSISKHKLLLHKNSEVHIDHKTDNVSTVGQHLRNLMQIKTLQSSNHNNTIKLNNNTKETKYYFFKNVTCNGNTGIPTVCKSYYIAQKQTSIYKIDQT